MARASSDALDNLHATLADVITSELKEATKADPDGKRGSAPASLLNAAIKFLKDNGVDTPAKSERISTLADELAAIDLDEAAQELRH